MTNQKAKLPNTPKSNTDEDKHKNLEEELEQLYSIEKEIIEDILKWEHSQGFYRLSASIMSSNGVILKLKGTYNPKTNNFSFILLHKRKYVVRQFDKRSHWNPDNTHVSGPHKHYWSDDYDTTMAYEVDDVNPDDINQAVFDFLDECKISYKGIKYFNLFKNI